MSSMSNLFLHDVDAGHVDAGDTDAASARLACMLGGGVGIADENVSAAELLAAAGGDPNDVWDWHRFGAWVVVPTNTEVRRDGSAVMGAGSCSTGNALSLWPVSTCSADQPAGSEMRCMTRVESPVSLSVPLLSSSDETDQGV